MCRIKTGSAKTLILVAASLAVWCGGGAAFARSFDFTFSGDGVTVSGVLYAIAIFGSPDEYKIRAISGSVSGFPSSSRDGAITSLLAPGSYRMNDNILYYSRSFSSFDAHGVAFTVNGSPEDLKFSDALFAGKDTLVTGTLDVSPARDRHRPADGAAPAPIPGAGLLSYLVLGFAGLLFSGKRIWTRADNATPQVAPGDEVCVDNTQAP